MIALYRGTSCMSRAIRFLNWSDYSHAAWITQDNTCIEAWITGFMKGSVIESPSFSTLHTKGTQVDFYDILNLSAEQQVAITAFMRHQLGRPYDFRGIIKFLTRGRSSNDSKWFCSELVFSACMSAGIDLLNLPAWKVYPAMLAYSPRVKYSHSANCGE